MDKYLSTLAKRLTPYVPGEQPGKGILIKLNTNENPFPPSPKAIKAMKNAISDQLRLYPAPESEVLREAIMKTEGLPELEYVYVGNGSDEILAFCFAAFFGGEKPVLFPDVTYSFYPVYCALLKLEYKQIPLDNDFKVNTDDYKKENSGIIIANPNAPTGIAMTPDQIIALLNSNPDSVVVIDEAYVDFGAQSMVSMVNKYPNLAVVKTISKSHALAGLRGGYIVAQPHLIEGIIRVKNSFNSYSLDTVAQKGMTAAILDYRYKNRHCERVITIRKKAIENLRNLGFFVTDSKANFIFASHKEYDAVHIADFLRQNNIIVRHFNKPDKIKNFLRISIGTAQQMKILHQKLTQLIKPDDV